MKHKTSLLHASCLALLAALATFNLQPVTAHAQGTAFTYQGRLNNGANPAQGIYDLRFAIYDSTNSPGTLIAGPLTNSATAVSNGLFTVTLDFGAGVFAGANRALDIAVRTNGGTAFTALSPRQALTPAPYAIMAGSASNLLGTVPVAQLSGTMGNSQLANNVVTINAGWGLVGGGTVPLGGAITLTNGGVISVTGNADITASTVNGMVTLGDTATSATIPNAIVKRDAGASFSATNLTLNGNLYLPATTSSAGIIYSGGNPLLHAYGSGDIFVGVNAGNLAMTGGNNTGIGAGALQQNQGGFWNTASGYAALAANTTGNGNIANGFEALFKNTSGGGNTADGLVALYSNMNGNYNTAIGVGALYDNTNGSYNIALGHEAGYNLSGSSNIDIGNMGVASDNNIIRIGSGQTSTFIAGVLNGNGGGLTNLNATILTGSVSNLTLNGSLIFSNAVDTIYSGTSTLLIDDYSDANFYAGYEAGNFNGNQFYGYYNVGIGYSALNSNSFLGNNNTACGAIALSANTSGNYNTACGASSLAANTYGDNNTAIGGTALYSNTNGNNNTAIGVASLFDNTTGTYNTANGVGALNQNTTGSENTASGGGALQNNTSGTNNIALGYQAGFNIYGNNNIDIGNLGVASDNNIIRIGLGQTSTFIAGSVQMSGNVVMNDNDIRFRNDSYHGVGWYGGGKLFGGVNVNGPVLYGGSGGGLGCTGNGNNLALAWTSSGVTVNGTFNNNSDRNAKQNFASVKPEEVLAKVAQLPVMQWSYKTDAETRHIGPMAQDFYAAFAVGTDERHIAPIDEGGVALAAIQGLNQKLNEKDAEIQALKARLEKLERFLEGHNGVK